MRPNGTPVRAQQPQQQDGPRVNDKIRAPEVRVIADDGTQLGVLTIREALLKAEEVGLDLVEVSPDAKPPVCKLIDFGKYKYQQSKKAHEAKKKQVVIEVKEIQLTPSTDKHDLVTKQNHIRRWIAEKCRVKVFVRFRGREMSHSELGFRTLNDLLGMVEDIAGQEAPPRFEGRRLTVTLLPKSEKDKIMGGGSPSYSTATSTTATTSTAAISPTISTVSPTILKPHAGPTPDDDN